MVRGYRGFEAIYDGREGDIRYKMMSNLALRDKV